MTYTVIFSLVFKVNKNVNNLQSSIINSQVNSLLKKIEMHIKECFDNFTFFFSVNTFLGSINTLIYTSYYWYLPKINYYPGIILYFKAFNLVLYTFEIEIQNFLAFKKKKTKFSSIIRNK